MPVELPFERLGAIREHAYLSRDQLVELGAVESVEVAIADEPALVEAHDAHERPVTLDTDALGQSLREMCAQLLVVQGT